MNPAVQAWLVKAATLGIGKEIRSVTRARSLEDIRRILSGLEPAQARS